MARLSLVRCCFVVLGLFVTGCPKPTKEGPPPPESYEITSAAPRALGAFAAGTDDAPPGVNPRKGPILPGEAQEEAEEGDDDGGVAPPPDAALETPEDIPLLFAAYSPE